MAEIRFDPTPFSEAVKAIRSKPALAREVFWALVPDVRARAITIGGLEQAENQQTIIETVRDAIADLPAGAPWIDVRGRVMDQLTPWLGEKEAFKRAELLMRMHGFMAYQAAQHEVMVRQQDVFPYWQYLSMDDGAVRETHRALDGLILPANHQFWRDHYPPWEYGCRCQVVPVTQEDYEAAQGAGRGKIGYALGPAAERRLTETGMLDLGKSGQPVDVRSPFQRATESGDRRAARAAFRWNPGDLRMPIQDILQRYEPEVRAKFETWAQRTEIPTDGLQGVTGRPVTVWDWLQGGKV